MWRKQSGIATSKCIKFVSLSNRYYLCAQSQVMLNSKKKYKTIHFYWAITATFSSWWQIFSHCKRSGKVSHKNGNNRTNLVIWSSHNINLHNQLPKRTASYTWNKVSGKYKSSTQNTYSQDNPNSVFSYRVREQLLQHQKRILKLKSGSDTSEVKGKPDGYWLINWIREWLMYHQAN